MSSVKYGCLYLRKSYSAMKEMKTKEVVRKAGHESGLEPVAPWAQWRNEEMCTKNVRLGLRSLEAGKDLACGIPEIHREKLVAARNEGRNSSDQEEWTGWVTVVTEKQERATLRECWGWCDLLCAAPAALQVSSAPAPGPASLLLLRGCLLWPSQRITALTLLLSWASKSWEWRFLGGFLVMCSRYQEALGRCQHTTGFWLHVCV